MTAFFTHFLTIGQNALGLIGRAVLPVLFPFFVLTSLIINLCPTNNLFLVAGLAYLSGYPNGTRLTTILYEQGRIKQATAQQLAILTSTPSPMFVIATAGTIFLQSTGLGLAIFICAVLGAIFNSFLWKGRVASQTTLSPTTTILPVPKINFLRAFNDAMTSSVTAIINVCGVVLFFYIFTQLLHLPPFFTGLCEMTSGVAQTINPLLMEFFVCFGGLSIAVQNALFATSFHQKLGFYFTYKITHALLACGLLTIYLLLF